MKFLITASISMMICLASLIVSASGQDLSQDFRIEVDGIVAEAYGAAAAEFPCSLKTRGNPKMLRWQEVDQCLNHAAARVDYEAVSRKLRDLRKTAPGWISDQFEDLVRTSLSTQALAYEKVFKVKEAEAFFPLTNSVLKFLPPEALQNLPVFDKTGIRIGSFSGIYSFERTGGDDSTGAYKLTLFQYTDPKGEMQSSSDRILLDSFGISWNEVMRQSGFCLESERLLEDK